MNEKEEEEETHEWRIEKEKKIRSKLSDTEYMPFAESPLLIAFGKTSTTLRLHDEFFKGVPNVVRMVENP